MPINITNYNYAPIFKIRPAEMVALEELPEKDKDMMIPIVLLRGWLSAGDLSKSFKRLATSFGSRPLIIDLDYDFINEMDTESERPAFKQLLDLEKSNSGYKNWVELIDENENLIPCLQLKDPSQLSSQISQLKALGRGIAVRFTSDTLASFENVLTIIALEDIEDLIVIIDYGQEKFRSSDDVLVLAAATSSYLEIIASIIPAAICIVSATSFPSDFSRIGTGSRECDIFERALFNEILKSEISNKLIYSDRGSARAEVMGGGGGVPSPRIDFATKDKWKSFRTEILNDRIRKDNKEHYRQATLDGYKSAAIAAIGDACWDKDLHVWGTQMIVRTAKGDKFGIDSPVKSTSVRINLHLHQQTFYGLGDDVLKDTDDDWQD